jgi:hypothetical protein
MFAGAFNDSQNCPEPISKEIIDNWCEHLRTIASDPATYGHDTDIFFEPCFTSQNIACLRRRLFVSFKGYIGLCPESANAGDSIFAFQGCIAPIFLRTVTSGCRQEYHALGHGYVHGIMNGEATTMGLTRVSVSIV